MKGQQQVSVRLGIRGVARGPRWRVPVHGQVPRRSEDPQGDPWASLGSASLKLLDEQLQHLWWGVRRMTFQKGLPLRVAGGPRRPAPWAQEARATPARHAPGISQSFSPLRIRRVLLSHDGDGVSDSAAPTRPYVQRRRAPRSQGLLSPPRTRSAEPGLPVCAVVGAGNGVGFVFSGLYAPRTVCLSFGCPYRPW